MSELRSFYIKWMTLVAFLVTAYAMFVLTTLEPQLDRLFPKHWISEHSVGVLTARATIMGLLWLGERLVRKWLWRRLHPELDFSGHWIGTTTYAKNYSNPAAKTVETVEQEVRILQDCLSLRLEPSTGANFTFESRTIDISADGARLTYGYYVKYAGNSPYRPDEAYGYEELSVVAEEDRRPIRLKGWFAHCMRGQTPVYSGDVELTRKKAAA